MDIQAAIRREALLNMLRQVVSNAREIGAPPDECLAAFMEMGGRIYATGVSGAQNKREEKRAHAAFTRGAVTLLRDLPSAAKDAKLEAILIKRGF